MKRENNQTYTENGAVTLKTANSDCLDLFARIGALRNVDASECIKIFARAYAENPDYAMRILFFARDIRQGLGERKVFRNLIKWLATEHTESVLKNITYIAEYGRWDDLLSLLNTPCEAEVVSLIKQQIAIDKAALNGDGQISLLGKWLPSVNASSLSTRQNARHLCDLLKMKKAEYRSMLTAFRARIKIIENNLREKDYTFDYSMQPTGAMLKYRNAFIRNDEERYLAFCEAVNRGETTIHTGTLYPYDIISNIINRSYGQGKPISSEESLAFDTMWKNLESFPSAEDSIAVVDGSGSMYSGSGVMPISVALSLGIYFAEHNKGEFKNHFITFSKSPQLVEIKGKDIVEKTRYCMSYNEVADTNIEAVFKLILNTAVSNNLPQSAMPKRIYIISDMEFNCCTLNADLSNFENAKAMFSAKGYELPEVIFWNVDARNTQAPVGKDETGTALVSGCTPKLFDMVLSGDINPYKQMLSVIEEERYKCIFA